MSFKKFKNIKNIVILGYTPILEDILKINKKLNFNTFLITSPDQKKKNKKQNRK